VKRATANAKRTDAPAADERAGLSLTIDDYHAIRNAWGRARALTALMRAVQDSSDDGIDISFDAADLAYLTDVILESLDAIDARLKSSADTTPQQRRLKKAGA
jgi:hypothetical protein